MEILIPLFVLIFVILIIVGGVYSHKASKRRQLELAQFAASKSLTIDSNSHTSFPAQMALFPLFNTGFGRSMSNTMTGKVITQNLQINIITGDYTYKTKSGSGKNETTSVHNHSYLLLNLPFNARQTLNFRKEGMFDKITSTFGFNDINFESAEFSRKFHITSDDKKFAYDIFESRMMQWLLDNDPPAFNIATGVMLVSGSRWKVDQFASRIAFASDFFDRWPEHLVQRLGATIVDTTVARV